MKRLAVLLFGVAIALQVGRDRIYARESPDSSPLLYVRSPEALKRLALGFDALAADIYWIRTVQYYGRQRLSTKPGARDYSQLYPLLDLTTSLDPHFDIAYRFGAIFLSEQQPGGPGRPDLAEALLKKGIAAQPEKWQFYHDAGFIHYWTRGDAETAARWLRQAAELPNAPSWIAPIAATMLAQGNDRESARALWRQLQRSEEEWLRRRAAVALAQLDAMDQIDQLEAAIARAPGPPYTWSSVVRAGVLPGVPVDPSRTPYQLDPQTGKVSVSRDSALFPMPPMRPR